MAGDGSPCGGRREGRRPPASHDRPGLARPGRPAVGCRPGRRAWPGRSAHANRQARSRKREKRLQQWSRANRTAPAVFNPRADRCAPWRCDPAGLPPLPAPRMARSSAGGMTRGLGSELKVHNTRIPPWLSRRVIALSALTAMAGREVSRRAHRDAFSAHRHRCNHSPRSTTKASRSPSPGSSIPRGSSRAPATWCPMLARRSRADERDRDPLENYPVRPRGSPQDQAGGA